MGKLHQVGNVIVRVYANDHLPPHFHVLAPDFEALVEIASLVVVRGSVEGQSGKRALAWAVENKALIAAEWNRINPRFPMT